jgi:hypothetical protein
MMFWINLVGYQLVWFISVYGAGHGNAWLGVAAAVMFVVSQVLVSNQPMVELRLLAVAVCLGMVVDGALAASGGARYAASAPALPSGGAPVWILGLWAAFALTLNQTLTVLGPRPWLALAMGAIGAPLAYMGAARGWQALVFEAPAWRGLLWLALSWAIAMPLLATLAHDWTRTAQAARGGRRRRASS